MKKNRLLLVAILLSVLINANAQDDLLKLLGEDKPKKRICGIRI